MIRPSPHGMNANVTHCYGIYNRPTEFPDLVVIWGWSRSKTSIIADERPFLVDSVDAARRAVKGLLGPEATQLRCYDPAPVEVWGLSVVSHSKG